VDDGGAVFDAELSAAEMSRPALTARAVKKKDPMTQHIQPCKGAQSGGQTTQQSHRVKMLAHHRCGGVDPVTVGLVVRPNAGRKLKILNGSPGRANLRTGARS